MSELLQQLKEYWPILAGLAAACFTLIKIWREISWQRASRSLDLLLKLNEQFRSDSMIKQRMAVAQLLQLHLKSTVPSSDPAWTDLDDLLDFFQIVATLVREGHVSKEVTYNFFAYWFIRYWYASPDRIALVQKHSPISWKNAQWLYKELKYIDIKHNAAHYTRDPSKDLAAFLLAESTRGRVANRE